MVRSEAPDGTPARARPRAALGVRAAGRCALALAARDLSDEGAPLLDHVADDPRGLRLAVGSPSDEQLREVDAPGGAARDANARQLIWPFDVHPMRAALQPGPDRHRRGVGKPFIEANVLRAPLERHGLRQDTNSILESLVTDGRALRHGDAVQPRLLADALVERKRRQPMSLAVPIHQHMRLALEGGDGRAPTASRGGRRSRSLRLAGGIRGHTPRQRQCANEAERHDPAPSVHQDSIGAQRARVEQATPPLELRSRATRRRTVDQKGHVEYRTRMPAPQFS